jgi:DNA-binding NarL/FixJ family response regulator
VAPAILAVVDNKRVAELTVLLADTEVATRAGVRRVLERAGMRVVSEATSARQAVEAAVTHRPAVCLLDVGLPGNGTAAAARIAAALPDTKIVMLTSSGRDEDLFRAIRAGAVGYLLKSTSAARLPHAIRGVLRGEAAIPRELMAHVLREFRAIGQPRRVEGSASRMAVELSPRQFEVLQHLREGSQTSEIATDLRISEVTVRRHISEILRKLEVPDRRAALELLDLNETPAGVHE